MKNIILVAIILFTYTINGQNLDDIVKDIININEVQDQFVGLGGSLSQNYLNFEKLEKNSSVEELLKLINHKNSVVSCYASWALIEKKYAQISDVFNSFLRNDKSVMTYGGCIKMDENLSSLLYHRYWNTVKNKEKDLILLELDSIILNQEKPYWLLLTRALENRVYPKKYNLLISELAFRKNYKEAIFYLSNWYKAEYRNEIKKSLIKYLKKNNFKNIGTSAYYDVVFELLKLKDDKVNKLIIDKLREDKHWKHDSDRFNFLFEQYYIYESDLEN